MQEAGGHFDISYLNNVNSFVIDTDLKILCLNVCGLRKRLEYPEFIELTNDYDICCFQETKTDDYDSLFVPG